LAVLGSLTFSGKAIIVKLGYRYGVDAVTLLMLRMLFALPLFMVMAWWAGRGRPALTQRDWLGVLGLGFSGFYLASALDFAGLVYITASLERLILCLQPTLVLLLGWLVFRRRILRGQILGIAVSYAGVLLVFGQEALAGQNREAAWGTLLVLLSTASYAIYLLGSGAFVRRLGAPRLVGLATSVACVLSIVQYLLLRPAQDMLAAAPQVMWLSLLNATLCTAVPVLAVMMAIERIGPAMASQVGMIGPIFTILLGVVILGEPFTASIAAGAALVVAGILLFTRAGRAA
jgi:drug/metabolite transporter (DMT)-like permease